MYMSVLRTLVYMLLLRTLTDVPVATEDTDWCVCVLLLRTLTGVCLSLLRTLTGVCLLLLRTLTGVCCY